MFLTCRTEKADNVVVQDAIRLGPFKKAEMFLIDKINQNFISEDELEEWEIQMESISRIRKEFPYNREDIKKQLEKYYPHVTDAQLDVWEKTGQLEMRLIDEEKRYFKRAVSNFFRLNKAAKTLKETIVGKSYDGVEDFQQTIIPTYFENGIKSGIPFDKRRIKVSYTIALKANQIPEGEVVRCWMPYARTSFGRLPSVEFLNASEENYIIAPEETKQRSVYMEKQTTKDQETVFEASFIFTSAAQWFDVSAKDVLAYDKSSILYKTYTAERLPHIILSDEITNLAKQIVGTETNPVKRVELLYYWLNENIPWAGALEYSVMPCIPEYVLENQRGDCGMQTFLLLSLARSLGIPCKWQSGWYLLPQEKNLHDWAEVYYEGIGWVPVDPSFNLIQSNDKRIKEFYMNGLDSYRFVVNDDYGQELYPAKKYYRSEPYDFQRGELEWEGGNLYFDTWSYKMEVEYLD
jgi:transglutaminase-like putative cysteine protease